MRTRRRVRGCIGSLLLFIIPVIADAQSPGVGTRAGIELGGTVSHYRYEEPSLGVKLEGYKGGVDLTVVTSQSSDWFLRWEGRYEYGKTDYTGSGTKNNNPDWYAEVRGMIARVPHLIKVEELP